jgi:aspartyl-tRNA(Asn)/glutamyl-tRNA(Gln) amidotransferase subunit B
MKKYIPKIGLEIHVELKTKSKMFCKCDNNIESVHPNTLVCPVCLGFPGVLPVANKQAIDWTIKTGLALNCKINNHFHFDRKHYFYPDLPKSYQISQYEEPICENGWLEIHGGNGENKKIRVRRVHQEEDTAKLIHPSGAQYSLIDFNRSSTPLMEIVTEPDIKNAKEAKEFCQKIRIIMRYLDVSNADMEKGEMRCEANISVSDSKKDGTKVEVKNLNSFKSVEKAIEFEIERQTEVLESGGKISQETRGWHDTKQITFSQRSKETAPDYRYFPEPDLPPFEFTNAQINKIKETLPELPDQKIKRFVESFKINLHEAEILVSDINLANYFEEVISHKTDPKKASNWIITNMLGKLKKENQNITDNKIQPKNLAELINKVDDGIISGKMAKEVFNIMFESGKNPETIIKENKMEIISNKSDLENVCEKIIQQNLSVVEEYRKGKEQSIQFLIGQIMKETRGKANPKIISEILKERLRR